MMKRFFIGLVIYTLTLSPLIAQTTFERSMDYGGGAESGFSVLPVPDGMVFLGNGAGSPPFPNYQSIKLFKLGFEGDTIWKRQYHQEFKAFYSGKPTNLKRVPRGGFVFAGSTIDSAQNYKALLCYLDDQGDTILFREYGKPNTELIGYSCYPMPDSGFVITGLSNPVGSPIIRFWAMRVDNIGDIVWDTVYANNGITGGFAADYNPSKNLILLSGYSQGMPWLMEVDSIGHIIWQRKFISNAQCGTFARYTTDGGILFNSCLDTLIQNFTGGTFDQPDYIAKLDSNRNLEWRTFFPLATEIQAISAIRETNGGYLFAGLFYDASVPFFGNVGWVGKLDYAGQPIWHRFFQHVYQGYNSGGDLWGLDVAADGSIVAVGTTFEETQDFWVAKLDSMGCLIPGCDTMPCRYPPCEPIDTCPNPPCVGVAEILDIKAKIYPNPTNGQLTIEVPQTGSPYGFSLINLLGQKVYDAPLHDAKTTLHLNLPSGLYIYQLTHATPWPGQTQTGKLLVE